MAAAGSQRQPNTPLIGREREQGVLEASLHEARDGRGQLVLLAGEPGIGKTRLAAEAADHAASLGIRTFWGHCFEWAGTPAYWPWIEILRDLLKMSDPGVIWQHLEHNAPLVAQIVPELSEMSPELPSVPSMNPEQARFRLFDGVTRMLVQLASEQPLVLVIEDLHWADPASLLLLEFVSHKLDDMSLLVIGTYRDVEVRRDHPLASTLASLVRRPTTQRLPLSRLQLRHVAEMMRHMAGVEAPQKAINEVYAETEGNPFFATEVIRLLVSRQYFDHSSPSSLWHVSIPESVREVIGRGLDQLSDRCNEMLRVASVVGREFNLPILQSVSTLELNGLLTALDEAIEARMVEERTRPGSYRFTHTLIQETLYDELSSSRRFQLHGLAGATIEREHRGNLSFYYGDLARHFRLAPFGENVQKAIDYGVKAGDQAMEQVAWESAAGHYQRAVELLEAAGNAEPERLCELLMKFGEAQGRAGAGRGMAVGAGNDPVSRRTFMRAAQIARDANLHELQARAALAVAGVNPWAPVEVDAIRMMDEALRVLPQKESHTRSRLLSRLSRAVQIYAVTQGADNVEDIPSFQDSVQWSNEAIEIARRLGDPATLAHALIMRPLTFTGPLEEIDDHLCVIEELLDAANRANDPVTLFWGHAEKYHFLLQRGDVEAANQMVEVVTSIGESLKLPVIDWALAIRRAEEALLAGRYDEADAFIDRANQLWPNSLVTNFQRFSLQRERGQEFAMSGEFFEPSSVPRMVRFPFALVHSMESEMPDDARARLRGSEFRDFLRQPKTPTWIRGLTLISEVCAELDDSESAALVYEALNPFGYQNHNCVGVHDKGGGCISHYLGLLATTLERWDDAERHFAVSLDLNQKWGFPPYVAYTQFAWADMLLRRGDARDRERVRDFLMNARAAAQHIGMVRLLTKVTELERRPGHGKRAHTAGLSAREMDVLRLLVEGKSDREIGDELFISRHTVMRHVSSIRRKLDVDSRGAAAVYAVRNELV